MKNLIAIALATGSALAFYPTGAFADFPGEVEHARANARAGGPVSAYDAELLRRWGCLSGTRSPFCGGAEYRYRAYRGYRDRDWRR